ncbi:hypothetical protein OIU77_001898 [Salix suchowensis]|uniref:NOT transcription complex subunit VIP2 n=1 Tax=Salix suchowensis TaxID=1278906 RepID=A0ABQ9B2Z8_9ROSI|nr:hypothetical protein OIU77_001898 [Salix suchowensis]
MPAVNQPFRDQGIKSMQAAQSMPDPFGLLGLLSVIRMNDPDLTSLALGIDLTTLGLNLNSTENLHKTFGSPWSEEPAKGDPEFNVPKCYYAKPPPPLDVSLFLLLFFILLQFNLNHVVPYLTVLLLSLAASLLFKILYRNVALCILQVQFSGFFCFLFMSFNNTCLSSSCCISACQKMKLNYMLQTYCKFCY